jgi:hypothetical protein
MTVFISSIFHIVCFPLDGKSMTINPLSFVYNSPNASVGPSILMVDNSQPANENIDVRMYFSLIGTFNFMALIHHVYTMSSRPVSSLPILTILGPYLL